MYIPVLATVDSTVKIQETMSVSLLEASHVKLDDGPFTLLTETTTVSVSVTQEECCKVQLNLEAEGDLHYYQKDLSTFLEIGIGDWRPSQNQGELYGTDCGTVYELYPFISVSVSGDQANNDLVETLTVSVSEGLKIIESLSVSLTPVCKVLAWVA